MWLVEQLFGQAGFTYLAKLKTWHAVNFLE
jgi:hypothetical protein